MTQHLHSRPAWGARQWRDFTMQGRPREAFIHHGAEADVQAEHVTDAGKMYEAMRQTQAFHMNTRGWADIAYHYVVFQPRGKLLHANACEGRPVLHVPAAQLNRNTGTLAICVYGTIDAGDPLHESTVKIIASLLRLNRIHTVGGHRDVTPTDCPGRMLYDAIGHIAQLAQVQRFRG